ncbi:hypothetical protein CHS0354_019476 [Potamilus streckersoni]|uniref:Uncharacterized protein n=1 Tax=Potamilus streckersoni TaxID=2493646 RepID=A0AAE0SGR5_9BIVA|nr:hypothetical protein CHS0354_019476 [Potamilus streckersoni]
MGLRMEVGPSPRVTGTAYVIIPMIGGYIADSMCGRYRTILGSGFIFLIGTILLFFSAGDFINWFGQDSKDVKKALLVTGLVVVTIGSGGLQANIIPFGAQHITHMGPRAIQSFCHWYYWVRNLGCIASSSVVYLQQETKQFCWGYLMSILILLAGLVIFGLGHNKYNHVRPSESVLKKVFIMCCNIWRRKRRHFEANQIETSFIHEVKTLLKILPIYGFVTVYWMSYAQMSTSLFLQSERLDLSFGDVTIPPAFLIYFNAIMLVLFIPLMDFVIYPLLIRCDKSPSYIQRIGIGMFLAVLALSYAAGLELCRKNHGHFQQEIFNIHFSASNMSVFHQVPIFTLLGQSEVWTSITGLEFAYIQIPDYMQGLTTDWYPIDPLKNGRMENLFFLIAGITFFFWGIFVLVTRFGYSLTQEESQTRINDPHSSSSTENTEQIAA